jgi:hypothetical protein
MPTFPREGEKIAMVSWADDANQLIRRKCQLLIKDAGTRSTDPGPG